MKKYALHRSILGVLATSAIYSLLACAPQTQPTLNPVPIKRQSTSQHLFQRFGRTVSLPEAPIPDWDKIPAPSDNPVTQGKVELGFRLWFEPRLSANNRMTCGTCHHHMKGFSNAERNALGVTGQRGKRNVPTSYGSMFLSRAFWDGRAQNLEIQSLMPIQDPIEMNERIENVIAKLQQVPYYTQKFKDVYGSDVTADGMAKALASFQRALTLEPTPYERYQQGEDTALSPLAQKGFGVFIGKGRCFQCHRGPAFSNQLFVNIGIGMDQPNPDLGRYQVTKMERDKGAFKTPTLLNIAKTAPYMHDGSLSTLDEVIEHYNKGGIPNPQLDPRIQPLHLSPEDKGALKAFLIEGLSAKDNLKAIGKLPGIH